MSFSLSADEYALFVSHYTRKPEEHNDIHFIFSLNQSRFMHLIFNIIQKDICEHICHFLVANNMVLVRGWLVAHSNDEEKNMIHRNIVNVLGIYLNFMDGRKEIVQFDLKIYISSSNIWKLRLLALVHVPAYRSALAQIAMSFHPK